MFVQLSHVGRMAHPGAAELAAVVEQFQRAARRAVDAGLDGVEIDAANDHLLHQFLADSTNHRSDRYGGTAANRARLTAEVVEAVAGEIGAGRVGVQISPGNAAGGVHEVDKTSAYEALLERLCPLNLGYLHVLMDPADPAFAGIRPAWAGPFVLNTGRDKTTDFCQLETLAGWGVISAITAGGPYIDDPADPDLVARLQTGAALNEPDYPTLADGEVLA
jgi:N-ethylmaleimide reductase